MKLMSAAACGIATVLFSAAPALAAAKPAPVAAKPVPTGANWTEEHKVGHDTVILKYQYSQHKGVPALAVSVLVLGSADPPEKRPAPREHRHVWRHAKVNTGFGGEARAVARHTPAR